MSKTLSKMSKKVAAGQGSVFSVKWNPKGHEFCVVYGLMPAKATLFNLKCEPVHHFAPAARNSIYYNPFGNLLLLGGFGNLRGSIEMWETTQRRLIGMFEAPDTTQLEWSPDGEHFFTATCAPRLRQGNGFKIWSYTGKQLYERPWNKMEELWEVTWQTFPPGTFEEPVIRIKATEVFQNIQQHKAAKIPYRPPSARAKAEETPQPPAPESVSKKALKLKKKREAKKARKDEERQGENSTQPNNYANGIPDGDVPDDPEKQKKIKKIKAKLNEIIKLKEQVSAGKKLELNQLEKIKKEEELVKELKDLFL